MILTEERLREIEEQIPKVGLFSKATVKLLVAALRKEQKENGILRGVTARLVPCRYCGVNDIAKCPSGFPGCGLADDILAGEDTLGQLYKEELEKERAEREKIGG